MTHLLTSVPAAAAVERLWYVPCVLAHSSTFPSWNDVAHVVLLAIACSVQPRVKGASSPLH